MPGPWPYRLEITDQVSQYTKSFRPPAAAFYVSVSNAGNLRILPALLDTGADLTVIPHEVAILLSLRQVSKRKITSANGQEDERPVFKGNLSFLGFSFSDHPMVSLERRKHMLIGRDIINRYKTTLDGPILQFSIE